MAVATEKVLALKAFYMGHAIAGKHEVKAAALSMVDAAIDHYRSAADTTGKTRLAFYLMLRAEIRRHDSTPLDDRREAQRICQEIRSPLYDHFMTVENATQTTKKLVGIQSLTIVDDGIKRTGLQGGIFGFLSWGIPYDIAARALEVGWGDLSSQQKQFLESVSLKDILEKHGVRP